MKKEAEKTEPKKEHAEKPKEGPEAKQAPAKEEHKKKPAEGKPGAKPAEGKPGIKPTPSRPSGPDFEQIIRIASVDVDGGKRTGRALLRIKGVGPSYANAMVRVSGVGNKKAGDLTPEEIKGLEEALANPEKYNIPSWMVNRRKDYDTGTDKHISGADLIVYKRQDITRLQKVSAYRGIRHGQGLKVRGQRTRSTGRKGKTLGVARKGKIKPGTDTREREKK